jgi:hypothetical protein
LMSAAAVFAFSMLAGLGALGFVARRRRPD